MTSNDAGDPRRPAEKRRTEGLRWSNGLDDGDAWYIDEEYYGEPEVDADFYEERWRRPRRRTRAARQKLERYFENKMLEAALREVVDADRHQARTPRGRLHGAALRRRASRSKT